MTVAYDAGPWHDLFAAAAGATAALAGLIFVAVALNQDEVLRHPGLPPLAARAVGVLVTLLVVALVVLAPGQPTGALGVEVLVLGTGLAGVLLVSTLRAHDPAGPRRYTAALVLIAVVASAPLVVAGLSLLAGRGGGLYWVLAGCVGGLAAAMHGAWVLLIEIRR